jgi:hypothetical protein
VDHPFYRPNSPAIATLISPLLQWRSVVSAARRRPETGPHCGRVTAVATALKASRRAGNNVAAVVEAILRCVDSDHHPRTMPVPRSMAHPESLLQDRRDLTKPEIQSFFRDRDRRPDERSELRI